MSLKSPKLLLQFTLPLPKRCHFIRTSECWESLCASSVMESCFSSQNLDLHNMTSRRNSKTKRKFSDEQIKSLEIMFEAESRPEPRRKQQLANELGLQPHQVAIWFQNRRARLKTKQIELEYRILKASYDTLASSFESLEREHQSLLLQSQKLKSLLGEPHGSEKGNGSEGISVKREPEFESKEMAGVLSESDHHQTNMLMSDAAEYTAEETGTLNMVEPTDGSPTSLGDWCSSFLDESSVNSEWWEL